MELGGVLLCAVLVFYRKMQNIGCIFIAVLLVISGACTTKSVMAASSNVMQVYENYTNGKASAEDMMKAYEEYEKLPANIISNVLVLLVHAAAGLCANYLYAKRQKKASMKYESSVKIPSSTAFHSSGAAEYRSFGLWRPCFFLLPVQMRCQ